VIRRTDPPVAKKKVDRVLGVMLVEDEELIIYNISLQDGNFRIQAKGVCANTHPNGLQGIVILDPSNKVVFSDPDHDLPLRGGITKGDTLDVDFSLSPYAVPKQSHWVLAK
jgi:hypothetical protein